MLLQLSLVKFLLMKRVFMLIVVLAAAGIITYLLLSKKDHPVAEAKPQALVVTGTQGAFDQAFAGVLTGYYALQAAFVDWDTVAIHNNATALAKASDSLHFTKLTADESIKTTALNLNESLQADLKGLLGETTIDGKRRSFNTITDELYNLIRTVHYDGSVVYHMRCPMAFGDDAEGFWLSGTHAIINPYLGNKHPVYKAKMLGCGEVVDSIQYATPQK